MAGRGGAGSGDATGVVEQQVQHAVDHVEEPSVVVRRREDVAELVRVVRERVAQDGEWVVEERAAEVAVAAADADVERVERHGEEVDAEVPDTPVSVPVTRGGRED